MILTVSIAIGLALGFLFYEWIGFLPGGLVVPGYIALYWDHPFMIASTLVVSLLVWGVVRALSKITILYGRRRFTLMIIMGFLFQWLFELVAIRTHLANIEIDTIGYIIPGLIANEMDRQGIVPTASMVIIVSVIVRLILIVFGFLRAW